MRNEFTTVTLTLWHAKGDGYYVPKYKVVDVVRKPVNKKETKRKNESS